MANYIRGEIDINIGNKLYVLIPNFQALCEIENITGKSIISLVTGYEEKGLLLQEQIAILKSGLKASNINLDDSEISKIIETKGVINLLPKILKFLQAGLGIKDIIYE